jgi:hypothetical protein
MKAFDPLTHQPPRLTSQFLNAAPKGHTNILASESAENLTKMWQPSDPNRVKTRSALQEQRNRERVPDSSYDLNGDGAVCSKDYLIGKLFDKEKKGKLST